TKIIRASIQEIYAHVRKSCRSHFPMTGGLSILDSLLDNLNELLKSKDGSILLLLSEIEEAKFSLTFVAYEVDYAINSILLKKGKPTSHLLLYLSDVVEEIKHIKLEVREIIEQMPASSFLQMGKSSPPVVAQAVPHIDDNVVAQAWCCISQHYNVEDLLLKIYCQVVGRKGKIIEDDVADKLPKILMGK
ncbi:hypothetical protein HAX54_042573, partial [Datura stramonium]|nr:hypothetical protein [Datura stramonium]